MCSWNASPSPCATPPCTWPSTIMGLRTTPQSSTSTSFSRLGCSVSRSMRTSATCAPKPQASRLGSKKTVSCRPGSRPGNGAVPFECQLGGHGLVTTLIRGEEILAARGDPLDGPAELQRQVAGQRFILVERALAAEASTDIGRDHAYAMLGKADSGSEVSTHEVRTLGREP